MKMFVRRMILLPRLIAFIAFSIGIYCLLIGLQSRSFGHEAFVFNYETSGFSFSHANESSCSLPALDIYSPEIMKHVKHLKRLDCGDIPDWVYVRDGSVRIEQNIVSSYPDVRCSLQYVIRKDDDHQRILPGPILNSLRPAAKLENDFFVVYCSTHNGHKSWSKLFAAIRLSDSLLKKYERVKVERDDQDESNTQEDIEPEMNAIDQNDLKKLAYDHNHDKVKPLDQPLNVLFYGLDSLSRVHFQRKLPKTYKALTKKFNATVLQMYNIVGDGSPQALIPILTGKTELELPLTLKNVVNSKHVNVYPFIWNNFSQNGYVTQYGEDTPHIGTFTYRMKGFDKQPTDFYLRPFYLQGWSSHFTSKNYCYSGSPRHSIMTEWAREFFETYQKVPKYAFNFHAEISHDDFNLVQIMDDDLIEWLDRLDELDVFNSSLVIFMSDHGARFSSMRSTLQGKFEERLPFFSIMVPSWFENKFPNAYHHLKTNAAHRFMTPFDIYSTVMTVLTHFNQGKDTEKTTKYEHGLPRSISVFQEIPAYRSCEHCDVESHWCSCLQWINLETNSPPVLAAGQQLVNFLNNITADYRSLCEPLQLEEILRAQQIKPKSALLQFKKSADTRGFVPDLSGHTETVNNVYQLQIRLKPSGGLFEGTVSYLVKNKAYVIKESEISRINMYGDQDRCIHDQHPHLRKYCYCRN